MYNINYYTQSGEVEHSEFMPDADESVFSKLEEALYILYELTPTERDWRRLLYQNNKCHFDYHGLDVLSVAWDDMGTFTVHDDKSLERA